MLADIVLDTNVLLHCNNPLEPRHKKSCDLLKALQLCTSSLCVDEGFSLDEASNRSQIGTEYLKHLRFGMLGHAVIAHLARTLRVRQVPRGVPGKTSKQIRQVGKGPDRVYVQVAFNSESKTLASHDFKDIPPTVRRRLLDSIGVSVVDAAGALEVLQR